MEQFDLTVFKIGLEKGVFQPNQIIRLIYGDLIYAKVPPDAFSLVWNVSNFNHLPIPVRKQLVQLLRKYQPQNSLTPVGEVDVYAHNCAFCALNSILQASVPPASSDSNLLAAVFNANATPVICVKEIINWAAWGITLDDEVWETANLILNVFLKDAPERETVYERVMAKKFELYTREKELSKDIDKSLGKLLSIEDKLLKLEGDAMKNDAMNDFCKLMLTGIQQEVISRKVDDLYSDLCNVHLLMGQAEIYHLIKRHYNV